MSEDRVKEDRVILSAWRASRRFQYAYETSTPAFPHHNGNDSVWLIMCGVYLRFESGAVVGVYEFEKCVKTTQS